MKTEYINGNGKQCIITDKLKAGNKVVYFKSYGTVIVKIIYDDIGAYPLETFLDEKYWKHSSTTSKYRSIFLNETTKKTEKKIKSGQYKLINLNK
jgi:S-adenosylmethionine:tRNA-ribosyltransferase-isomerase (queuine synthetase)